MNKSTPAVVKSFTELKKAQNMSSSQSSRVRNFDITKEKNYNYPDDYLHSSLQKGPENESIAVVIDGTNLFYLSKLIQSECVDHKFSIDFDKLAKLLSANFPNLRRKWYVTSQIFRKSSTEPNKDAFSPIRALLDFLSYNSYDVVTRDITIIDNGESDNRSMTHPPSLDVDITTCLFKAANIADHIIFIGSDKRYATPLRELREMNKSVTVISVYIENKKGVADELRKIDNFVNIANQWFIDRLNTNNEEALPRSFEKTPD